MSNKARRMLAVAAVITLLTVIFTGCVMSSQSAIQAGTVEPTVAVKKDVKTSVMKSDAEQVAVISSFDRMIRSEAPLQNLTEFLGSNINQLSKERSSALLLKFEDYQKKALRVYAKSMVDLDQGQLFDANGVINHNELSGLKPGTIKSVLTHLEASGLKIQTGSEQFEPTIDYTYYIRNYSEFMTPEVQEYFKIRALESERPCFERGSLAITWQELLDRMQRCEDFIIKNNRFERLETVKVMYLTYFKAFIYGGENTPVFNAEDGHIQGDVAVVYQNMKLDERNLISKKYLKSYFSEVQKSKFKCSEQVEVLRLKMTQDLMKELHLTEQQCESVGA